MSLDEWTLLHEEEITDGWVRRVRWGQDDNYLFVAGGPNEESIVVDAADSNYPVIERFDDPGDFTEVFDGDPSGNYAISAGEDADALVRTIGEPDGSGWGDIAILSPGPYAFGDATWSPDGSELALGGKDGNIVIYTVGEWSTPDRIFDYTADAADGVEPSPLSLTWSDDERYIATGWSGSDLGCIIIDAETGNEVTRFNSTESGNTVSTVGFERLSQRMFYTDGDDVHIIEVGDPDGTGWNIVHSYEMVTSDWTMHGDWRRLEALITMPITHDIYGRVEVLEAEDPHDVVVELPSDGASCDTSRFSHDDDRIAYGDRNGMLYIRRTPDQTRTEVTIAASVPDGTSCTVTVHEDDTLDGTPNRSDTIEIIDGTHTYFLDIIGKTIYNHWLEVEMEHSDITGESPELNEIDIDDWAAAGSVVSTSGDGVITTEASSLTTE